VLGGSFGLPHARTHAVMLPHVVAFNAPAAPAAMGRLASAINSDDAAAGLRTLNQKIGITYTLSDLGLRERDLDRAAEEIAATPYPNPRPASLNDITALLRAAL